MGSHVCSVRAKPFTGQGIGCHGPPTPAPVDYPRPKFIALVVDDGLTVPDRFDCRRLGGAKVVVLENDAAVTMPAASRVIMRWPGPSSPDRSGSLVPFWHPLAAGFRLPWLRHACRKTREAFVALDAHDRYAGALGVLRSTPSSWPACWRAVINRDPGHAPPPIWPCQRQ